VASKRSRGRPVKLEEYQAFVLRLPPELHRELLQLARDQGKSLNDLFIEIAQEWREAREIDKQIGDD